MTNVVQTFRFNFSSEFMTELEKIAKINQYADRHYFKKNWDIWCATRGELIQVEIDNLNNMGYEGDIIDKMYKSARYYFRKKSIKNTIK